MAKIRYVDKRFSASSLAVIEQAEAICVQYAAQGFDLTLRQLYYQFVARGLIPNRDTEYKRLGGIINDARLAGLLDWDFIVDRTRHLRALPQWDDPAAIVESAARSYRIDKWESQRHRVEVWIEKDALVGVIQPVCERNQVPYFACRGYASQSEVWAAGQRLALYANAGSRPVVLHLGDHDPSGIDMTRDITDRLELFMGGVELQRLALNMDQIDQYQPPPNPAKTTDSRYASYIRLYGDESWELDALDPLVIDGLIQRAIVHYRDEQLWNEQIGREAQGREVLEAASDRWPDVARFLETAD